MNKKIQIIIPCYNEEKNIDSLLQAVEEHLLGTGYQFEFLFVDDGSTDGTFKKIQHFTKIRSDVKLIRLSRNFGKEAGIKIGLDIVMVMLQFLWMLIFSIRLT